MRGPWANISSKRADRVHRAISDGLPLSKIMRAEIIACDFFTSVTATFQVMYVFIAIEIGSRRILHVNVTDHPTAEWTRQQFREFVDGQSGHRYVVHDRDTIFSAKVDEALSGFGLKVLKTPVRSPMANAHCERVIGTIRRECLDYLIPMNERHLKRIVREFATYYNRGRPHSALGPGLPEPNQAAVPASRHRYELPSGYRITKTPVLGGLHHDYRSGERGGLAEIIPDHNSRSGFIPSTASTMSQPSTATWSIC